MKKPREFLEWCASVGIAPNSHDESIALASWRECARVIAESLKQPKVRK